MGINKTAAITALLTIASAASATSPGPGGTQISTAHATYGVSIHTFDNPVGLTRTGTGFGAETISIPGSLAVTHAEAGVNPYASAYYDNASGSGHGSATNTLTYAYRVRAADAAAAAALAAYLAAQNGVGVTATGVIALHEGISSYGGASGSVDLGAGTFAVSCSHYYGGGDCGTNHYTLGGLLTASGALNTFGGLAYLTASTYLSEGGSGFGCGGGIGGIGGGGGGTGPGSDPCFNPSRNHEYAYVDPTITLASGFTTQPGYNAANYVLTFSPGIGGGAVPEPASWALLIAGFGMVGLLQRRRSQPKAFAA